MMKAETGIEVDAAGPLCPAAGLERGQREEVALPADCIVGDRNMPDKEAETLAGVGTTMGEHMGN
jgi:hypothetical protein